MATLIVSIIIGIVVGIGTVVFVGVLLQTHTANRLQERLRKKPLGEQSLYRLWQGFEEIWQKGKGVNFLTLRVIKDPDRPNDLHDAFRVTIQPWEAGSVEDVAGVYRDENSRNFSMLFDVKWQLNRTLNTLEEHVSENQPLPVAEANALIERISTLSNRIDTRVARDDVRDPLPIVLPDSPTDDSTQPESPQALPW